MNNNTRNPQRTAEQWQSIVNRQIQSGLSGAAFCKAEGFQYQSFMNWRKKLENTTVEAQAPTEAKFVELTGNNDEPASSQPHWHIELDLAPGVQLRIAR